ncbi:uncharacterized protein LOC123529893 [Mercenaria mercenaria]|uniref:uncharacterized protein LOC123529893 n=1 Tax=Mercenaria mercenaria TaxID=6596 RepID=UPI001E1D24CE|nr:uncharacterized protein LOC123529893 [Mercenaria mercenaria]XP_045166402.1 uncharacterized protein LOC123529893 [Mercenaria mercenaria]XP_045166403.1 uncharacterized protein LOC123529893 [Mercenaria mercenaria]XP_045166404.1 uncharacterized protein LOC123529893 [Mercenaria mercenaria]XP_045166405.1 uncharacterized protein LOC123529893 [Mercenaria mercenaria]
MHSGQKSLSLGRMSDCLTLVFRRKQHILPMFCILFVFSILFMSVGFTNKRYTKQINHANTVASEIRHVHECHCLVTVAVPKKTQDLEGEDKSKKLSESGPTLQRRDNMKQEISQPYHLESVDSFKQKSDINKQNTVINPKEELQTLDTKKKDSEISLSQRTLKIPDDLQRITLKPNFTRLINASQIVTTVNATYTLENPTLCSSVRNLSIVVIVHTSPDHIDRRLSIRNTWANDAFYLHLGNVRTIFLLGKTKFQYLQSNIEKEFKRYGDLLQGDFIDDYHNLTLKGVMAYKWLTERCRNAELILKVDDDISVDMFKLFTEYYPKYRSEKMSIICNHILAQTMGILRQNDSKWYVSNNHFKGLDAYPTDYCSGFLVIFTNDLIPALYQSSRVTPFFWVDDVYLYGLVPGNVPGLKYIGLTGNWHQLGGQDALRCYRNATETCPFLVAGAGAKGEPEELWPQMVKRYALSSKVAGEKIQAN